jgi:DNA-binding XRE family transcriptional regulator
MAKKPEGDKVSQLRRMREERHAGRAKQATEAERVEAAKQALAKKTKGNSHE